MGKGPPLGIYFISNIHAKHYQRVLKKCVTAYKQYLEIYKDVENPGTPECNGLPHPTTPWPRNNQRITTGGSKSPEWSEVSQTLTGIVSHGVVLSLPCGLKSPKPQQM